MYIFTVSDISHFFTFILAWSLLYFCISFLCFHVDILWWECFLVLAGTQSLLCTTSHHCQGWRERDSLACEKKGVASGPKTGTFSDIVHCLKVHIKHFCMQIIVSLLYFVINIVAVTVCFLYWFLFPVIWSYPSPWSAFCASCCGG